MKARLPTTQCPHLSSSGCAKRKAPRAPGNELRPCFLNPNLMGPSDGEPISESCRSFLPPGTSIVCNYRPRCPRSGAVSLGYSPFQNRPLLDLTITRGWFWRHMSGAYVKFTPAGAELFA
jgi:hypothetical protein